MANVEHNTLVSNKCHEPRHITNADTADSGMVITPSSSQDGTSVLRRLTSEDVQLDTAYGEMVLVNNNTKMSLTAAADSNLYTASDYIQVLSANANFDAGALHNCSFQSTSNELRIEKAGLYRITAWFDFKSDSTGIADVGLRFTEDGSTYITGPSAKVTFESANAEDIKSITAERLINFTFAQELGVSLACSATSGVTMLEGTVNIQLIDPD